LPTKKGPRSKRNPLDLVLALLLFSPNACGHILAACPCLRLSTSAYKLCGPLLRPRSFRFAPLVNLSFFDNFVVKKSRNYPALVLVYFLQATITPIGCLQLWLQLSHKLFLATLLCLLSVILDMENRQGANYPRLGSQF
jgi:hypothetical protein